ncbi:MAG: MFS transporter [Rhizobiaceae bacterium]
MFGIIILAAAYVISHFYRSFLAVLSPQLSAELSLSPAQLSDALGVWFAAFALSQFLVGVMLDRFGPKWTTAGLFAVCGGGGGLLFALAQSQMEILLAMLLLGVGCAPVLMASVYIFKRSYDGRKFATLASTFIAVGLLGNILGASPLALAMESFGWRAVMMGLAILTLLLSTMIIIWVGDPEKLPASGNGKGGFLEILRMRELWFILPLIFVNYGVVGGIRGLWAGPYLDLVHNMSAVDIGYIMLAMAIAMTAGSFVYGPADRIFNTRKWVILAGGCCSFASLLYWNLNPGVTPFTLAVLLMVIGFCSLFYGLLMAHATANIPDHMAGRGVTLVNFFNMGGVGVLQWVSSEVYRQQVDQQDVVGGFSGVLLFYLLCLGAALAIYAFSRDSKPNRPNRPNSAE